MQRKRTLKSVLLIAAAAVLMLSAVGGTIAFIITRTDALTNTFQPGSVTPWVDESFDGTIKKNVRIQNKGTVPAYIRAAVIGSWCDASGNIVTSAPVTLAPESGWFYRDGYYYYEQPVLPGSYTSHLIGAEGFTPGSKPAGADHFEMDVLTQAVQAEGMIDNQHPAEIAWDVQVENQDTPDDYLDDTLC